MFTSFQASASDTLEGGTGRDQIYGADGNDVLYGGDGDDSGSVAGWSGFFIRAGLFDGDNDDFLDGGNGNDLLDGGNGTDTLTGSFGDDTAEGGAGVDNLSGGDGNDLLNGGTEADQMSGGLGDDTFLLEALDIVIEAAGGGFDTVRSSVSYGLSAGTDIDVLRTDDDAGTLAINLTGNALAQTLIGNAGANILSGLDGNDTMSGLGGNDQLLRGLGNDVMDGGAGADLLIGGRGSDRILTGGADGARDTVRYTSLLESGVTQLTRDQVRGFVHGQDKVDLKSIDADPTVTGNQAFHLVSAFTSAKGEARLVHSGSSTLIQLDGDRDTGIDTVIAVIGSNVTVGDLIL